MSRQNPLKPLESPALGDISSTDPSQIKTVAPGGIFG